MGILDVFRKKEHIYDPNNIERFVEAQDKNYQVAMSEIRSGRKKSHWIWYVFPQLKGLGRSAYAQHYGISGRDEAEAYLSHKKLGRRLREITQVLQNIDGKSAHEIFGGLDAMKVCSSMTLFDAVCPNDIFEQVLEKYYNGNRCNITLDLLKGLASVNDALCYIGVDLVDFSLTNAMFARPVHAPIHGIGHIYRTMIGCALLGKLLQKPREGLLAFCGAYIHDLARETDGEEPEHGANAVLKYFDKFNNLWDKYQLTQEERELVKQAVIQHSGHEWMQPKDSGYHVMAILKDADALDRCRIGDLVPEWLRYPESHLLIKLIETIYSQTYNIHKNVKFCEFVKQINWKEN